VCSSDLFVYGDEYRRENLRYISNYWPLFEAGAAVISREADPVVLAAPEGEVSCREMSAFKDVRVVSQCMCAYVPETIDYPHARYTSFKEVFNSIGPKSGIKRIGVAGLNAMSSTFYKELLNSVTNAQIVDGGPLLYKLRLIKTRNEINCLKEATHIADEAFRSVMEKAVPGMTETEVEAEAQHMAKKLGAECLPFCYIMSGKRAENIIGRSSNKVIEQGDMVMAGIAVQYEGYVATTQFPFVVGKMSKKQKDFIDILIGAEDRALPYLKAEVKQKEFVIAARKFFKEKGVSQYDIYPPLHGCGTAEAESPYPDEKTEAVFEEGMTVNMDFSLFGHPGGSNRIEEGFVITRDGHEPMSPLVRKLIAQWKKI
jgi:Xaa-Pro aminopeptidase